MGTPSLIDWNVTMKLTKKILIILLSLLLIFSGVQKPVLAEDPYTVTVSPADNAVKAVFSYYSYAIDSDEFLEIPIEEGKPCSLPSSGKYMFLSSLESYDTDNYLFDGWKLSWKQNGIILKETTYRKTETIGSHEYFEDNPDHDFWLTPSGVYMPLKLDEYLGSEVYDHNVLLMDGIFKADFLVEPIFVEKDNPTYTPVVRVADTDKGSIPDGGLQFVKNTTNGEIPVSRWKLSTLPSDGYELSHIQAVEDANTRVNSEDGETVEWDVSADGAEYLVYFRPWTVRLGDSITYGYEVDVNASQKVHAGQRVFFMNICLAPVTMNGWAEEDMARFYLYAGNDTSGTLLGTRSGVRFTKDFPKKVDVMVDSIPADVSKVTLAARIGESGELTTKTFDVSVAPSGKNTELTYLDNVPGVATGYSFAEDQGPAIYDVALRVDAASGALTTYFATNNGVVIGRGGSYSSIPGLSGEIIAVGTDPSGVIYAISIRQVAEGINQVFMEYRVHQYVDDAWQSLEPDGHKVLTNHSHSIGLIMDASDIWLQDAHWDGSGWRQNDVEFNSFWKADEETAYAGSDDGGIYRYVKGSGWTKVSGTSGPMTITSACRTHDGVKIAVARYARWEVRVRWPFAYAEKLVAITGNTASVSQMPEYAEIDVPSNNSGIFGGIAADGAMYAITAGRYYNEQSSAGYMGSYLYKFVNGKWQYQIVDSFNDPVHEDDNPLTKYRPDGVTYMMSPYAGITYFLGDAGAIYAKYGQTTIHFITNGGSEVADITRTIESRVTAPASPQKEGWSFAGWYTDPAFSEASRYRFDKMPAKDITLYAKWDESGASLIQEKESAREELAAAYNSYSESDYDADAWAALTKAYEDGKAAIDAADSYDAIQNAKNTALSAMAAVEKSRVMTVAVTVEKLTVDGNFIIEPTLITTDRNEKASVVVTDILKAFYSDYAGTPYRITGTIENAFYLAGVYDPTYNPASLGAGFSQSNEGFLSEFDGGSQSGWMYCVNGSFPGVGASDMRLNNKDVMRWQYSCRGLGADIGADNSSWGSGNSIWVADKDALIWRVAEINQDKEAFFAAATGNKAAYDQAMAVLKNIPAPQADVDAALIALGGTVEDPAEKLAKAKAAAIQTLQNYVQAGDYRDAEQKLLAGYIADGTAAINAAEDIAAVNTALNHAKQLIDALKTDAAYTAEENAGKTDVDKIYRATEAYIKKLISVPSVGSIGGEWVVVGLIRAGADVSDAFKSGYYAAAVSYINEKMNDKGQLHRAKSTDNSRMILALTALGKDVTDIGGKNLLTALADFDYLKIQGINGPIWALIALDTHDYEIPVHTGSGTQATRENLISAILAAQLEDGGWALSGNKADPDMTAMALQSLAKYYAGSQRVKAAVDRAVAKLSAMQSAAGGYASWGTTNSESCAQVITALTALGIDPAADARFIKNGISVVEALCGFYVDGGGFRHVADGQLDGMATEQGYYALVSWYRLKARKTRLYDMTDVTISNRDQAQDVIDLIAGIGKVTEASKGKIDAARKAYDALTAEEKALVTNYAVLTAAEKAYASLKKAGGDTKEIPNDNSGKKDRKDSTDPGTTDPGEDNPTPDEPDLKDGQVSVTIGGVTYVVDEAAGAVMEKIAELMKADKPDGNAVAELYRAYEALTDAQKAQVKAANYADLEALMNKVGAANQADVKTGVRAENLPWYIWLVVEAKEPSSDIYAALEGQLGGNKLLVLWDISLMNLLTGEKYEPTETVRVRVPAPDPTGYDGMVMAHYTKDGRLEYIEAEASDGELVFDAISFSLYGVVGYVGQSPLVLTDDTKPAEEPVAETPWLWIVIAVLGVTGVAALAFVIIRKQKKAVLEEKTE